MLSLGRKASQASGRPHLLMQAKLRGKPVLTLGTRRNKGTVMAADEKPGSWWQTIPGIITGVATLLGSLAVLLTALNQMGVFHGSSSTPTASPSPAMVPAKPTATLPSVTGVPFADARRVLRSLGFTNIRTIPKFSGETPGIVIEQVPNPGTDLPLDQLVSLMVAEHAPSQSSQPARPSPPVNAGPEFAGIWEEIPPLAPQDKGRPMWLNLQPNGAEVTVQMSYTGSFAGVAFGQAVVSGGQATWTHPQGCAQRFRHSGYSYDNPGSSTFTLRFDSSVLLYEAQHRWTSPCDGHPIGVETVSKKLRRVGG